MRILWILWLSSGKSIFSSPSIVMKSPNDQFFKNWKFVQEFWYLEIGIGTKLTFRVFIGKCPCVNVSDNILLVVIKKSCWKIQREFRIVFEIWQCFLLDCWSRMRMMTSCSADDVISLWRHCKCTYTSGSKNWLGHCPIFMVMKIFKFLKITKLD